MRGVLFDLDGTLLHMDLDAFLRRYLVALSDAMSPAMPGIDVPKVVMGATEAMQRPHPCTNKGAFDAEFLALTGIDIREHSSLLERFYDAVFPNLLEGCAPRPGAREAVETALSRGMKVAVATQPIFPMAAIRHRLRRAGVDDLPFDLVTSYEAMHACKPHARFFEEVAASIGCAPAECMMVGDDATADMAASAVGMRTCYVGSRTGVRADHHGDMTVVASLLERSRR